MRWAPPVDVRVGPRFYRPHRLPEFSTYFDSDPYSYRQAVRQRPDKKLAPKTLLGQAAEDIREAASFGSLTHRLYSWAARNRPLSLVDVSLVLHRSAKHHVDLPAEALVYLRDRVARCPRDPSPQAVGNALFGMQRHYDSPAARGLLLALTAAAARCPSLDERSFASACFGFSGCDDIPESRAALCTLVERLDASATFGPVSVASLLFGMHRVACEAAAQPVLALAAERAQAGAAFGASRAAQALYGLRLAGGAAAAPALLDIIADGLRRGAEQWTARDLSTALYGLAQHPDTAATRAVIDALVPRVAECASTNGAHFATAVYGLKEQGHSLAVDRMVGALASLAQRCEDISARAVGQALIGLQGQPPTRPVLRMLRALAELAARARLSDRSGLPISNALYGLRTAAAPPTREARGVLCALLPLARQSTDMRPGWVAMALYGLKSTAASPESQAMLLALRSGVAACSSPPSATECGMALRGLQHHGPSGEARALLGALGPLVARRRGALDSRSFGQAASGMRLQTDSPEVRVLLAHLCRLCPSALSPAAVSAALVGLSNLPHVREAELLLLALAAAAARLPEYAAAELGTALYGLSRRGSTPGSRAVLRALCPFVGRAEGFTGGLLGMSLFGLQGQSDGPEVRQIVGLLALHAERARGRMQGPEAAMGLQGIASLRTAGVDTARVAQAVMPHVTVSGSPALVQMLRVSGASSTEPAKDIDPRKEPNASERAIRNLLQRAGVAGLRFNVLHDSGVEMDILCGSLNVELDTPALSYTAEGKRRLHHLRDAMLQRQYGIRTRRVQASPERPLAEVVRDIAGLCRFDTFGGGAGWDRALELAEKGWGSAIAAALSVPSRAARAAAQEGWEEWAAEVGLDERATEKLRALAKHRPAMLPMVTRPISAHCTNPVRVVMGRMRGYSHW